MVDEGNNKLGDGVFDTIINNTLMGWQSAAVRARSGYSTSRVTSSSLP